MNTLINATRKPTLFLTVLMGGVIFTSCASAPNLPEAALKNETTATSAASLAGDTTTSQKAEVAQVPRSRPQLVKKAAMSLIVDYVDKSVNAVSEIINKQQGDLISLQEQQPTKTNARHTASIQLRVPQNLLQPTLDELAKLGTVQSRNISAEDVGDRLVDIQARLTNLRKTEVNLQKIMDRAGSVRDVLSVAQELSQVRQSIEQIAAQLKNLTNQVTYSTITLKLEAAVSSNGTQRALSSQLQESWNKSTNSFGDFTVGLLKLGIWLMVYSPYFLALAAVGYGFNRWRRGHSPRLTRTPDTNSD